MFDLVLGLPVHALVVHAVVILLPLVSLATVAAVAVPRWRGTLRWWVVADAVMVGFSFVARESGEQLQQRLSQAAGHQVAHDHAELGDLLPIVAVMMMLAAVVAYLLVGRTPATEPPPARRRMLALATVGVMALAATSWTVVVGHSGAQAVWHQAPTAAQVRTGG